MDDGRFEIDLRIENNKEVIDEMQNNREGEMVVKALDEKDEKLSME